MDTQKRDEISSEIDELIVDIEELKEGARGTDATSLNSAREALERARELLDTVAASDTSRSR